MDEENLPAQCHPVIKSKKKSKEGKTKDNEISKPKEKPFIPVMKQIKEEVFNVDIHNHSLYFYGTKKKEQTTQQTSTEQTTTH